MKWVVLALVVVSASQVLSKGCKTHDECAEGECCVGYVFVAWLGGHCQKYREEGEVCPIIDSDTDEIPEKYQFMCPCKEGLECLPDREYKIGHVTIRQPGCVVPGNDDNTEEPQGE